MITKTNDGYVVELFAKAKINSKVEEDAEGISILEPEKNLVEDELYSSYREIAEKMEDRPVILKAPELEKETTALKTQLRAMLRAAKHGDISIMFSQIATVAELNEYKEILEECKQELEAENTPYKKHMKIGIVIEIPSAALMSYTIAKECDFVFIETNSLTNYTFGNKKKNQKNTELYAKFQPGVIKLVQQAKQGAHDAGIFCGICGDVIENELYMPLLIGLGLDQFSMDSQNIIKARKVISELDKSDCKELAKEILELRTIEDIERKLKQFIQN